jgi:UDP-N-acetylglucosamine 2-epimerase (non-hydrolysing)
MGSPPNMENYGLVTIHRHENIRSRKRLEKIIAILKQSPRKLYFPLHDNTRAALADYGLLAELESTDKIKLGGLEEYPAFLNLLSHADILYTDGGSIQEESLLFKVPCILLRSKTERIEGLKTEINYLSQFKVEETVKKAAEMVENDFNHVRNPYGDPGVSRKIVSNLEDIYERNS